MQIEAPISFMMELLELQKQPRVLAASCRPEGTQSSRPRSYWMFRALVESLILSKGSCTFVRDYNNTGSSECGRGRGRQPLKFHLLMTYTYSLITCTDTEFNFRTCPL